MFNPQSGAGMAWLIFRQRFLCACGCGYSWKERIREHFKRRKNSGYLINWFTIGDSIGGITEDGAHVDHIIPVSEGGETYGFDNCQALRPGCHLKKTVEERRK